MLLDYVSLNLRTTMYLFIITVFVIFLVKSQLARRRSIYVLGELLILFADILEGLHKFSATVLSIIGRILTNIYISISKEDSFVVGEEFETYVRENVFPEPHYQLIHQTPSYEENFEVYDKKSLLPDFMFLDRQTGKRFYVECKFRSYILNDENKIVWCNDNQLARYKWYHKQNHPVFIAVGLGGSARTPRDIALFSLDKVHFTGLYYSFIKSNSISKYSSVNSSNLWA